MHQGRGRRNRMDVHRVGLGLHRLQRLGGEVGVRAGKALGRHDLDALLAGQRLELVPTALAIGVFQPKERHGLHPVLGHVVERVADHQPVGDGGLEHVPLFRRWLHDGGTRGHGDGGHMARLRHLGHRQRRGRGGAAHDHGRAVLLNQLAHIVDRLGGVRGVVVLDEFDLERQILARRQLLSIQLDGRVGGRGNRRCRAGARRHHADLEHRKTLGLSHRPTHHEDGAGNQLRNFHECSAKKALKQVRWCPPGSAQEILEERSRRLCIW